MDYEVDFVKGSLFKFSPTEKEGNRIDRPAFLAP